MWAACMYVYTIHCWECTKLSTNIHTSRSMLSSVSWLLDNSALFTIKASTKTLLSPPSMKLHWVKSPVHCRLSLHVHTTSPVDLMVERKEYELQLLLKVSEIPAAGRKGWGRQPTDKMHARIEEQHKMKVHTYACAVCTYISIGFLTLTCRSWLWKSICTYVHVRTYIRAYVQHPQCMHKHRVQKVQHPQYPNTHFNVFVHT